MKIVIFDDNDYFYDKHYLRYGRLLKNGLDSIESPYVMFCVGLSSNKFKVVYDSANMLPSCDEVIPYYEYFADRVAHVHLKDMAVAETKPEQYANPGADGRFYLNAPHGTGVVDFDALCP